MWSRKARAEHRAALRRHFEGEPELRIAMETGTHSPWVSRLLTGWATK